MCGRDWSSDVCSSDLIIEFVASHNMAIATYNPQTQKFDRRNLPAPQKTTETTKDIERNER